MAKVTRLIGEQNKRRQKEVSHVNAEAANEEEKVVKTKAPSKKPLITNKEIKERIEPKKETKPEITKKIPEVGAVSVVMPTPALNQEETREVKTRIIFPYVRKNYIKIDALSGEEYRDIDESDSSEGESNSDSEEELSQDFTVGQKENKPTTHYVEEIANKLSEQIAGQEVSLFDMMTNLWQNIPKMLFWTMMTGWLTIMTIIGLWMNTGANWMMMLILATYSSYGKLKSLFRDWNKVDKRRLAVSKRSGLKKVKLKPSNQIQQNYKIAKRSGKIGRKKGVRIKPVADLLAKGAHVDEIEPYKVSEDRPFIHVNICGVRMRALIDTGASISCISMDVWRKLQEESGTPIPFADKAVVAYNYLGNKSDALGMTWLNVEVMGKGSGVTYMEAVPFCVTPNNNNKLILGQNIIERHRVTVGYDGERLFVAFKSPDYMEVPVHFEDNNDHRLVSLEDVEIPAKQTKVIKGQLEMSPNRRSNLDGKPIFVYDDDEEKGVFDQASVLRKGEVNITIHNRSKTPLIICRDAPVARFDLLTEYNSCHVDAVAKVREQPILNCFCKLKKIKSNAIMFIENQYGQTLMGYERQQTRTEDMGKLYTSNCRVVKLRHSEAENNMFTVKIDRSAPTKAIFEEAPTWLREYDSITFVYDKPEALDTDILRFAAWISRRVPGIKIRTEPMLASLTHQTCECSKKRISSKYRLTETKNYSQLLIYMAVGRENPEGLWNSQVVGADNNRFRIGKCLNVDAFPVSASRFCIMAHVEDWEKGDGARSFEELVGQLKPLFPNANVQIYINRPETEKELAKVKAEVTEILGKSVNMPNYWSIMSMQPRERPKVQTFERQSKLWGCKCKMCANFDQNRDREEHLPILLADTKWPQKEGEENPANWIKSQSKKVFVELVEALVFKEEADANQTSYDVKDFSTDFLEDVGEPLGYDDSWLKSKDYPIRESKEKFNWREVFKIEKIPQEAREMTTNLFDDFEELLSASKSDYRPMRHVQISLEPKDPTPFSMAPYPMPPHLMPHMNEIISRMEYQGLCVEGDSPVFVSSSFLVKKNSANFRSADTDAKNVPYKSSAGMTKEKLRTVGGSLSNPTAYSEPAELQEIDKQQGLKAQGQNYRLVIDYSKANVQIGHQLNDNKLITNPLNDCRFSRAQHCKYFSSIDISNAFLSMVFTKESRKYLHFHAGPGRLKASTVGSLGLAFLPSAFHATIWKCIRPELKEEIVLYVDDILVLTEGGEVEHERVLRMLFEDLLRANLLVNVKKIKVFEKEVEYLGMMVSGEGIHILPDRVKQFVNLPLPKSKSQLSAFLGIAAFMSSFIQHYQIRVAPLYKLLNKATAFNLENDHISIIRELAADIDNAASLCHLDARLKVYVVVDSSQYGTGGMIAQLINGRPRVIEFFSYKTPTNLENCLSAVEFEMIGLLRVIKSKPVYFHTDLDCVVVTDCRSVMLLTLAAKVTQYGKLNRWVMKLISAQVNFELKWAPNDNPFIKVADYLSRAPYESYFERHSKEAWNLTDTRELLSAKEKLTLPEDWKDKENVSMAEILSFVNTITDQKILKAPIEKPCSRHIINDWHEQEGMEEIDTIFANVIDQSRQSVYVCEVEQAACQLIKNSREAKDLDDDCENDTDLTYQLRNYITAEQIFNDQMKDEKYQGKIQKLVELDQLGKKPTGKLKKFRMVNGLLSFRKGGTKAGAPDSDYKIVLPEKSAIVILAVLHLFGHCSVNTMALRAKRYYYIHGIIEKASALVNSCKSCRLFRIPTKKNFKAGHARKAPYFKHTLSMDIFYMPKERIGNKVYKRVLSIADVYSRMIFSEIIPDEEAATTAKVLSNLMGNIGKVRRMTSDNGTSLLAAKEVRDTCKRFGVRELYQSFPWRPFGHAFIENENKLFRRLLVKNAETVGKKWPEVFNETKLQMNATLRRYNVPTESQPDAKPFFMSPHELVFGVPSDVSGLEMSGQDLDMEVRRKLRDETAAALAEYYEAEQKFNDEKDKEWSHPFKCGDYVLIRNRAVTEKPNKTASSKAATKYKRNVYMITEIRNRQVSVVSVFGDGEAEKVHMNDIKHFVLSDYLKHLPSSISKRFGEFETIPRHGELVPNWLAGRRRKIGKIGIRVTRSQSRKKKEEKKEKRVGNDSEMEDSDEWSESSSDPDETSDEEEEERHSGVVFTPPTPNMSRNNEETGINTGGRAENKAEETPIMAMPPEEIEQRRKAAETAIMKEARRANRSWFLPEEQSLNNQSRARDVETPRIGKKKKRRSLSKTLRSFVPLAMQRAKREIKPARRLVAE